MVGTEVLLAPEPTATAHVLFSLSCGLLGGLHVRLVRKENGHWDYEGGEKMKADEALGADLPVWRCTQNLQPKAKFTYRYVVSNGAAFIHLSSVLTFTPPPSPSPSSSSSLARDDGNFGALFGLSFPTSEQSLWLHSHTQLSLTVGYPEFYHYSPSHPRVGLVLDGDVQTYSVTSSVWSGRAKLHETSHDLHTTASFQLPNFSAATSVTLDVQLSNVSKGKVSVLTSQFVLGHGVITAPLMDASFFVIGSLTFHYSIITPFTHSSLQACNRQAFPARPTLVGHRGSGAEGSRTQIAGSPRSHIKENTLLSFEKAGTSGAHFVEFDAHLTSDMVPVIYHDFSVAHSGISTPIHAMTLAEFKKIGSKAIKKTTSLSNFQSYLPGSVPASSSATPSLPTPIFDSFPTLKETLQQVPANIGFNIEIKYPMKDELDHHNLRPVDRNTYVDCILWAVFEYAKNRDIVFSSFDPDICVLLSRKQPKYPVLFLTEMGTLIRSDPRSNSPEASIHFAKTHSLQGLVCPASFLLRNPNVVDKIKKAELVVATWGRDNNNPSNVDTQLALGVNGIIVDHVAHIAKHWNKAVVG